MSITKRGFLKSIGSVLAAGTVADAAQAQENAKYASMLNVPIGYGSGGLMAAQCGPPCMPEIPTYWNLPSWKAKQSAEEKRRFLRDVDPAYWRSGQFTSHDQKKLRWSMRQQYRKFKRGPWRGDRDPILSIQEWKAKQTISDKLDELRAMMQSTASYFPNPR